MKGRANRVTLVNPQRLTLLWAIANPAHSAILTVDPLPYHRLENRTPFQSESSVNIYRGTWAILFSRCAATHG